MSVGDTLLEWAGRSGRVWEVFRVFLGLGLTLSTANEVPATWAK